MATTETTGKATYNGWPNRATWNVALWIGNDEPRYRAMLANRPFSVGKAQRFAEEQFPNGETPAGDRLADIPRAGWIALRDCWNA